MSFLGNLRADSRRLVTRSFVDPATGDVLRQLVYVPRMPPVPSGTFVPKRDVFHGTLGPVYEFDVMSTPGAFFRKYGVGP